MFLKKFKTTNWYFQDIYVKWKHLNNTKHTSVLSCSSSSDLKASLRLDNLFSLCFLCLKIKTASLVNNKYLIREVVKTTILEQDPPNPKIDVGLCLHPPSSTLKDGVFVA